MRAWGWGEAHRIRFPPRIAAVLSSEPLFMKRTTNVLLDAVYSYGCLRCLHLSCLEEERFITENTLLVV